MRLYCGNRISIVSALSFRTISSSHIHTQLSSQGATSNGSSKKDVSGDFPKAYQPHAVEFGWYEWWEKEGFFKPDYQVLPNQNFVSSETKKRKFSMILPPPNVTGSLHLGHALTIAIEDALIRWKRMNGYAAVWVPGFDHAGIATQIVVERKLWQEKQLRKHDLGREKFLEEVYKWKDQKIDTITEQLKRLGASLDFSRTSFTMDKHMCKAVNEAFVRLFDEGLIYREEKFVNWSCFLQSVISDIEVEHLEVSKQRLLSIPGSDEKIEVGVLEKFAYPIVDSNEEIVVATTRLESMLGDTAVAVNPSDDRFINLIGKIAENPFTKRHLPIIADESVDKSLGTGAVKITPGHHPIDFDVGKKHQLEVIDILDDAGNIKEMFGKYGNLPRFTARKQIKEDLQKLGLYRGQIDHESAIPLCSRTGDIIEPRLKKQWFVNSTEMAERALTAVKEGRLKLIPSHHEKVWHEWLKNRVQDWCISRQLWWGHRIPAYRIVSPNLDKSVWVSGQTEDIAAIKAAKKLKVDVSEIKLEQDPDVLDTWFSSALLPFSAFNWPEKTEDLHQYYPLSLMETGYDIMFFWVARMVMLGQYFTQQLPFKKVLLHGMVCDAHGRKMSKSLGNVVDPIDVINGATLEVLQDHIKESHCLGYISKDEMRTALEGQKKYFPQGIPECGADSLRFALCLHDVKNHIVSIDVKHISSCKHFGNKIWQGTKFLISSLEKKKSLFKPMNINDISDKLGPADCWILSCLSRMVTQCNNGFSEFNLHLCTTAIRKFWVEEFCDVYIESVKPIVRSDADNEAALLICSVLLTCIHTVVVAISPFMPYLSEELYQRLSKHFQIAKAPSVTVAPYPASEEWAPWHNKQLEMQMEMVNILVNAVRSLLVEYKPKVKPEVVISVKDKTLLDGLQKFSQMIVTLSRIASVKFLWADDVDDFKEFDLSDGWVSPVLSGHKLKMWMKIDAVQDSEYQLSVVTQRMINLQKELEKLMKVISHDSYQRKAPMAVKEHHMQKKALLEAQLQKLRDQKRRLDSGRS